MSAPGEPRLGGTCREPGCFLPAGHPGEHGPSLDEMRGILTDREPDVIPISGESETVTGLRSDQSVGEPDPETPAYIAHPLWEGGRLAEVERLRSRLAAAERVCEEAAEYAAGRTFFNFPLRDALDAWRAVRDGGR